MGRWGKNLCLYSPIGAWLVVMWVKRAHNELVNPIEGSYEPPLLYVGFMTFWFSSLKSRKHWPLLGLVVKESCHSWRILSHSFFWLNRCDSLLGKTEVQLSALTWLSTSWCLGYLALLGQNQNWILFLLSLLKKELTAEVTGMNMFCRGSILDSKIFLAATMESVIRIMLWKFSFSMAGIRPSQMAMSSASTDITFIELICKHWMIELLDQIWATAVAICDFLTPPSVMTVVLKEEVWDDLKVWLRFWRYWKRSSSNEEEGEWKLILLEKWSTTLEPREKRGNVELKQFLILSRRLLTSLMGLLRLAHCLFVSLEVVTLCGGWFFACCESSSELMACNVTPQVNFPQKITFDMLYTNEFIIRIHFRALSIPSEHTTI